MKPPAASPGRAEKPPPQLAAPGLARLLLSKSRRGARSRRAPPATSPMFVSRGAARTRAADGAAEPSSPKVTCIGQVRMRKAGKKPAPATASAADGRDKARGGYYCRCLKKAFLCGGLFAFDSRKRRHKAPPPPEAPVVERGRRSPWVFSSRDVAVAAAPKTAPDPRSGRRVEEQDEDEDEDEEMQVGVGVFGSIGRDQGEKMGIGAGCHGDEQDDDGDREAQLVSSATTTPPKNALLLMRCRSAPQNRTSPLTSRFPSTATAGLGPAPSPSPSRDALASVASPAARKPEKLSPSPSPSPRKPALSEEDGVATRQAGAAAAARELQELQLILGGEEKEEEEVEDDDGFDAYDEEEDETMRCSSARPLVLQRCKSEPATTAAAKMAAGTAADATAAGCFWAHGGSSGRRRHAPPAAPPAAVALTGH
ncbi:serine/arginine repetitive matrix protein 3 [Sorghum bicolor]|uniref:Uncharacterized protein n=1 Tax=Sorghum bicolor TaxID=4558 RepID=A0A1Z5R0J6_SORBI|nr:serine/arginine repetitive matrix protein 3 [Sorghum bicolor]OQU77304.1 hypothetical protein SORBI_3009G026650 [Sorghum bicolor]|eukprot:XP_002440511.2 serine/arginine repetitive matrix protein 3 [Sorghum bicolor]